MLAGLVATVYGFKDGDALAAVGVSIFVGIAGYRLGRRTIDTLVDKAPDGIAEDMRAIAKTVSGVAEVEELRLRRAGPSIMGEISVAVPRTLPGDRIMALKAEVARAITERHPEAALTVTANLRSLSDETVLERVLMAAARRRLPIHHITIQEVGGVKSVGVDLELDARMPHGEAHEIASGLEAAIRDELGPDIEVDTHIEPMEIDELAGRDADPATAATHYAGARAPRGGGEPRLRRPRCAGARDAERARGELPLPGRSGADRRAGSPRRRPHRPAAPGRNARARPRHRPRRTPAGLTGQGHVRRRLDARPELC